MPRSIYLIALLCWMSAGCGSHSAADSPEVAQRVYFDSATKRAVVAEASKELPAMHPETGRRTLMPALYCAKCEAWRAAAPMEELQRNPAARLCAKCQGTLTAEGPLPTAAE